MSSDLVQKLSRALVIGLTAAGLLVGPGCESAPERGEDGRTESPDGAPANGGAGGNGGGASDDEAEAAAAGHYEAAETAFASNDWTAAREAFLKDPLVW